jgi:Short C-terminal domain/Phospholipase_D-nuclease N-terminal
VWHSFWDFLWSAIVVFAFIAYLLILFNIIVDLFLRDHRTPGWVKAVWVVFLIVFPYLTALIYLIARGGDMAIRAREAAATAKEEGNNYIREVAGRPPQAGGGTPPRAGGAPTLWGRTPTPAQEIAHAKELLDAGTITQAEFDALKAKAIS